MFPKQTISQKKCLMKKEDIRTTTTQQNVDAKKKKTRKSLEREKKEQQEEEAQPERAKQKQRQPNNTKHKFCTLKSIPTTLFFFFLLPPVFFCTLPLAGAIPQKQVSSLSLSLSLTLTPRLRPALLSSVELTGKVFWTYDLFLRAASSNLSYTYLYLMREFWYSGAFFVCNNSSCHELDACSQDSLVMMIRWLMMVMMV